MTAYDVKNTNLAEGGRYRIEGGEQEMPVLRLIRERFAREQPLKGIRVSACLHVTAETANRMHTLQLGGAGIMLCAPNPASTQDEAAANRTWTASWAPPTACWPARTSSSAGMAGAGAAWPRAPAAWAPASSSPRSTHCRRWKP